MPKTAAGADVERSVSEQLDALFAPWNRMDSPGLVVGVARAGTLLYRRGFGMASLETGVANTPRTRMRIGSTSKHFTALLALLLAEEGKLDIDAPIRTYIPELSGPGGDPTLRQLMQHRGGSRCYIDLSFIAHGQSLVPPGVALAAQSRQRGRNFAPGEAMIYNNGGYHLLSIAIERVGGAPFETLLADRLLIPMRMADTASIPSDLVITQGIATMHVPLPGGRWRRGLFSSEEVKGEGAMVSTVDDMLRWMEHLRRPARFGSPATWQALQAPAAGVGASAGAYALGLYIADYRGLRTISHSGGVIGGTSQMLTLPDFGVDIIIMVNGAPAADPVKLAEQVVDIVLADEVGEVKPTIPAGDYAAFLADWWSPETGMVYSLVDEGGVLKLEICKNPLLRKPLERAPDGRVILPELSMSELCLELDGAAEPDRLGISFAGKAAIYQRLPTEPANPGAFASAIAGRYYSGDANATATIAYEAGKLAIRLSDPFGGVDANLTPVGENVAIAWPLVNIWCALSFIRRDGVVTGFSLNSERTRKLEFERI